jgi:methylenetetrahydrofolate reductase (NADPH)
MSWQRPRVRAALLYRQRNREAECAIARTGDSIDMAATAKEEDARREAVADFVRGASIEITPPDVQLLPDMAALLPARTVVFVAHTPKATLGDVVNAALEVQAAGFRASAHVAARRLESRAELEKALGRLAAAGCDRVLLIAGDLSRPLGPFASTLDIFSSGILEACGLRTFGVAGHPEGHKDVGDDALRAALAAKQEFASRTGADVRIFTQFGFDAARMIAWTNELRRQGIALPVHPGLAGPASVDKLVRYAVLCGIGASLRAAMSDAGRIASLRKAARSADQVLVALAAARSAAGDIGLESPHFYPFGGTLGTAKWLSAVQHGRLRLTDGGFETT